MCGTTRAADGETNPDRRTKLPSRFQGPGPGP